MTSSARPTEPRYKVELTPRAARDARKLAIPVQDQIRVALEGLAIDPRGPAVRKLVGVNAHRLRSGAYRVVFQIDDRERRILVLLIAHRSAVYGRLARMRV